MSVIDEYLKDVPEPHKRELERIRAVIKRTVPDVQETMGYGMPAFKYQDRPLAYFASFKDHMSLFPTAGPAETLKHKLSAYKTSKGTIQFTVDNPLPESLIVEILQARLAAISPAE